MLTNSDILRIAMAQSAADIGCAPEDFTRSAPVIVEGGVGPAPRAYYAEPVTANFVIYGSNVVVSAKPEVLHVVREYVSRYEFYHLFETPNANWLSDRLTPLGHRICFMAEYFLPDVTKLTRRDCGLETRLLTQPDFTELYLPQWSNALCEKRKHLDILGVGAYDRGELVAFAACSADCEDMWQIGVDVLPAYRRRGIASAITGTLALEILERGKVPFYCCAWSNIPSARNAVRSGFLPAWAEMTVKPAAVADGMNEV